MTGMPHRSRCHRVGQGVLEKEAVAAVAGGRLSDGGGLFFRVARVISAGGRVHGMVFAPTVVTYSGLAHVVLKTPGF
jgi:hypothetical protein